MFSCSCISLSSMILRESRLWIVHFDILKINLCSYHHTGPISLHSSNLKGKLEDHHQSCVNFLFCQFILVHCNIYLNLVNKYLFLRSAQVSDAYGACAPIETLTSRWRWFWAPFERVTWQILYLCKSNKVDRFNLNRSPNIEESEICNHTHRNGYPFGRHLDYCWPSTNKIDCKNEQNLTEFTFYSHNTLSTLYL